MKARFVFSLLLVVTILPSVIAELPPLIPRQTLFGNPVKTAARISPDGKLLAFVAPDKENVLQVWVQTLGKDDAKQVTHDKKRGVRVYLWTYAADTLIYSQDKEGDENFHIYAVNVAEGKTRDLTPYDGVRAQPMELDSDRPLEMLVGMNKRDKRVFDVYRVNLTTGEAKLDVENPGDVVAWTTDHDFQVRLARAPTADGGTEIRLRDEKGKWSPLLTWGPDDTEGRVLGMTKDNKSLLLLSSEGRETQSLVKRDIATGKETLLAGDPEADVAEVILHPDTFEVEAVAFNREKLKWKVLDKTIAEDLAALEKAGLGEPSITSTDKERQKWIVAYSSDVASAVYYLYDRPNKKLTKLFESNPELSKYKLAPMTPVTIKSRDGLGLVSYLTLPVGVEAKNLPMVLLVHGGPWARDGWGYNPQAQWLANRGYAVLQVNFRGSTGFGKKFLNAGDRQWAAKMHDDLIDGVEWAVKKGYADPKKVAIMGGSYGGYAALVGATFTPDTFACAVSVVGPSNLVTLLKSIPPYWAPLKKQFTNRVGDLADEEFLKSRSPLFKVDKIKIPIMIAQGANDPRVKQAESEQIVEALRKADKPVDYLLFKDEGHGFVRPENRMKFFAQTEAFLSKHLGGRVEK
jgi:dipeptidyl aminopeptidase/acylaminoacyl peptidase